MLSKTKENLVASVVDVSSLFVAYRIGVEQLGPWAGIGYGIFDAWIVIWQRERISAAVHKSAVAIRTASGRIFARRRKIPDLPWAVTAPEPPTAKV